jgi:hypothetical protein
MDFYRIRNLVRNQQNPLEMVQWVDIIQPIRLDMVDLAAAVMVVGNRAAVAVDSEEAIQELTT